jgi:hypothetical protein
VKGCKILAYARRSWPLSREGSLTCHTCCDTRPRYFRSHPKDRPMCIYMNLTMQVMSVSPVNLTNECHFFVIYGQCERIWIWGK